MIKLKISKSLSGLLKENVIFPVLIALYPVFFLLSYNVGKTDYWQAVIPGVFDLFLSLTIYLLSKRLLKSKIKAGLLTTLVFFSFFSYGHFYDLLADNFNSNFARKLIRPSYALIVWGLLNLIVIFVILKAKKINKAVVFYLNIFSSILIVLSLFNIFTYEFVNRNRVASKNNNVESDEELTNSDYPDVYYIILDGNTNHDVLKEIYGYNNMGFVRYLRDKGFWIKEDSTSNYNMTSLSLASSLNMEYVNYLEDELGKDSREEIYLHLMIADNRVAKEFKRHGYKYAIFSSGWGPTNYSAVADINFQKVYLNEFSTLLLRKSMIGQFEFTRPVLRSRINYTFDKLGHISSGEEPMFVFAHILIPHPPWLFGANGENISGNEITLTGDEWSEKDKYTDQVKYAEKRIKSVIESLLNNNRSEIIIIQGDHGPSSTTLEDGDGHYLERLGILDAIFIPDQYENKIKPYEGMTPVNTFRLITDGLFDGDKGTLEDKNYYTNVFRPFDFIEVTDMLEN
jgi:hypothetical protein